MHGVDRPRSKALILALLATTQFMIVIDASIVNVSLPTIGRALRFRIDELSWLVNAYTLTFGGLLLLGGRLADLAGRRRTFMAGVALFSLASLAGGLAQSAAWLVTARAAQGVGAALISPAALAIISTTFVEGEERNRALGVWAAVAGAGGAAGVMLGGVLTEALSWRWIFFVNVPIAVAATVAAPRLLAESRSDGTPRSFDFAGALTGTGGLALLVYGLVGATQAGWGSTTTLERLGGAATLLALFGVVEARRRHPLLPFAIFRLRTLRGSNVVGVLLGMTLFSMFFFVSLYLQSVLGYSALETGLAYLPLCVTIVLSAALASQAAVRIGFKPTLVGGLLLLAAGLAWFSAVHARHGTFVVDVLGPSVVSALGLGLAFVPMTIGAMTGTSEREAGLASGLINTSQQVGGALGLAILASVANGATRAALASRRPLAEALTSGFHDAFAVAAAIALAGALVSLTLISSRRAAAEAAAVAEPPPVEELAVPDALPLSVDQLERTLRVR